MIQKWLVLGGTKEARQFIQHWRGDKRVQMLASIAGVTTQAPSLGVETRVGGFSYIQEDGTVIWWIRRWRLLFANKAFTRLLISPILLQLRLVPMRVKRARWQRLIMFNFYAPHGNRFQVIIGIIMRLQALFETVKTRHLFVAGGQEALSALPQDYRTKYCKNDGAASDGVGLSCQIILEIILGKPKLHDEEYALVP